jgi:hypothetical protein
MSSKPVHPELEDRPFYAARAAAHRLVVRRAGGLAHASAFSRAGRQYAAHATHRVAKFKLSQDPTLLQRDMELT